MARPLRIFGKKRGHRRTGSRTLASAGEVLFFAIMFLAGTASLILLLARMVVPEWRANHEFVRIPAEVSNARIGESRDRDGNPMYRPEALVHYELDGQQYDLWTYDITGSYSSSRADAQALVDEIRIGGDNSCWYDPLNPGRAVLVRGYSWWFWPMLLMPLGFMSIGGAGLVYRLWNWGRSPENQAVRGQVGQLEIFAQLDAVAKELPTVPLNADLTNSPGTHLKYRLPVHTSQGWRLLGATAIGLGWNAIVAAFVVIAVRNHLRGQGSWQFDLFIVPFLLAGGYLIYYFVRELLIATGVGPTLIEISDHPLTPGRAYDIHLAQGGHLSMNSLEVALECEERATYRQGTDTRTDRRTVHRQSLYRRERFEIAPAQPFEADFPLPVPAALMHSFKSAHNEVQWKIVVRGTAEGWPDFQRSFSIVVLPIPPGGQPSREVNRREPEMAM